MEIFVNDLELFSLVSVEIANQYRIVPKNIIDEYLELYTDQSALAEDMIDELELLLGYKVKFDLIPAPQLDKVLATNYRKDFGFSKTTALSFDREDFLDTLIFEAKSLKSSDIHFEIYNKFCRIRFRIDGQLIERYKVEQEQYLELVNKVKIRSKLNITEKRLPQDGRITTEKFDLRISILPTLFGEKIVMRILGQDASNVDLKTLGFSENELEAYLEAARKPNGIILISGPTGSGKTTTLYSTLRLLNDSVRNIVTIEDPIEYTLVGINQVQLKEDIGLTFAAALKSFLRQDPDVIMLGEIRDPETALMAIRASLTGHLVLSTIHTNSSIGTISRLIDMGVPSFLVAETLKLSLAQRLVRKLCKCKVGIDVEPKDFPADFKIPYPISTIFKKNGCGECFHTGYKGRTAIYELLSTDNNVQKAIKDNNLEAVQKNMSVITLQEKAFKLLAEGVTSLEEVYPILINA